MSLIFIIFTDQGEDQKGAADLKSEGNAHFKDGKYDLAAACYTQALKLFSQDEKDKEKLKERGVILKNRAACYLKLVSTGEYVLPGNTETLFRVKTLFWFTALQPNDDVLSCLDYEGGGGGVNRDRGTGRSKPPASCTLHTNCCPFFLASSL